MKKHVFILLLLVIPATLPLFHSGFFPSHDADWMTIRLSAFHQSLRDGHFPVRWSGRLNHSYGYPVFNFVYPLPFYFGEVLYLVTSSLTGSIKLIFALSLIASAVSMFLWLANRFPKIAALAGAVVYVYTPYRFVDTYVRGSIGESVAFIFPPLLFLGIDLLKKNTKLGLSLGAVAAAATLLSHNAFIVFWPIALIYGLVTLGSKYYLRVIAMFVTGALISAYFWLPALAELKYVYLPQLQVTSISNHLLNFRQLLIPSWGYGPAAPGRENSLSFQLGLVNIAIVVSAIWLVIRQKLKKPSLYLLGVFFATVFLLHRASSIIWQLVPGLDIIQFPWRLLSLTTFSSAALAAAAVKAINKKLISFGIVAAAILLTIAYARPQEYKLVEDSFYSTNESTTTIWNEYMPKWVTDLPQARPEQRFEIISGDAQIENFQASNISKFFTAQAMEPSTIKLATIYYPGWEVRVNEKPAIIRYQENNGMIAFVIPSGNSQIQITWQETPLRKLANSLSLMTLFGLLGISIWLAISSRRETYHKL